MPNPMGAPTSEEAEDILTVILQSSATANGSGTVGGVSGYAGTQTVELSNGGSGTCTVTIEGSYDGSTWYACGYQQIDGVAGPIRSVSGIAVAASPFAHVYALLDAYSFIRARISSAAGALSLTATLRAYPI